MKIKVKFLTNVWDAEQKIFDKKAQDFFVQGQVKEVFETQKINECLAKKTVEKVLDSTPEILDPGNLQAEIPQAETETETPQAETGAPPQTPNKTKK